MSLWAPGKCMWHMQVMDLYRHNKNWLSKEPSCRRYVMSLGAMQWEGLLQDVQYLYALQSNPICPYVHSLHGTEIALCRSVVSSHQNSYYSTVLCVDGHVWHEQLGNTAQQPYTCIGCSECSRASPTAQSLTHYFHHCSWSPSLLPKPIPSFSSASLAMHGVLWQKGHIKEKFLQGNINDCFSFEKAHFCFFPQSYMKIYPWHNDTELLMNKALWCHKRNVLNVTFWAFSIHWH